MTKAEILRQTLRVVGGTQKLIGFPNVIPFYFRERSVAALDDVIVHGDDVERGGVGGSVGVGIIFEPGNEVGALGDFVGDFSVFALIFADEFEGFAGGGEIAGGIECQGGPHRVAAKKPGKSGALAFAGRAVAGHESGSERWIGYQALNHADAGPVIGALQLLIGQLDAYCF